MYTRKYENFGNSLQMFDVNIV